MILWSIHHFPFFLTWHYFIHCLGLIKLFSRKQRKSKKGTRTSIGREVLLLGLEASNWKGTYKFVIFHRHLFQRNKKGWGFNRFRYVGLGGVGTNQEGLGQKSIYLQLRGNYRGQFFVGGEKHIGGLFLDFLFPIWQKETTQRRQFRIWSGDIQSSHKNRKGRRFGAKRIQLVLKTNTLYRKFRILSHPGILNVEFLICPKLAKNTIFCGPNSLD